MTWYISSPTFNEKELPKEESLYMLGNGYVGVRGNFEEGYPESLTSIRGTYLNAFHDITKIPYGEKLHAFPETQQKLVNVIDAQTVQIYLGEERERFSLWTGEILSYSRVLNMKTGYSDRTIHWRSPRGKEVRITFQRLVSMIHKELFTIHIKVEPVNFHGKIEFVSSINGNVSNFVDINDPRVASGHSKRSSTIVTKAEDYGQVVVNQTLESKLQVCCVSKTVLHTDYQRDVHVQANRINVHASCDLIETVKLTKWNIFTDTLRHGEHLVEEGIKKLEMLSKFSFVTLLEEQQKYLEHFWESADIHIDGDSSLQEGIRFNLFQLLQSAGRDRYSNIAAKGLSGEGYEGHYFWDTEIYMFPVFLMTNPELAKQLLIYRYSILDYARARAKEMGHSQGALFPWRTISGTECSTYYPAGTAQYHISGDVAYSYILYYLVTQDKQFIVEYGAEVLMETARLWMNIGHYHDGFFKIDAVTGPDEYTCIVNNNYYTNVLAKYNLKWAAKVYHILEAENTKKLSELKGKLALTAGEVDVWIEASRKMYLPYDEKREISLQDDTFLQKDVWDFAATPKENYPLLLHYHPLTLYRYQVCKQPDTILGHFLLEDEQEFSTIKNSYDYYEKLTTHDSSLSSCIFSIMASKVGYHEKAYKYFMETARLDLDNTHKNTKDGLHMANMGGTWMAIIYGFAGLRVKESGLSFAPSIPKDWNGYTFRMKYQERFIEIVIDRDKITLTLLSGVPIEVKLYNKRVNLSNKFSWRNL
ncbi:glycoside hydrolase family 65 protein [Bacillus thuringiensis]|uniref:Family 65 glycosyl hydrolase n=1 Tax=Bacillus thuringiensis serovar mexicanensis TaxID=180868 RepID=A0A242WI25_BACTU|nr:MULTISPECIES: glycosyl hydrolase family 65 protein [Bacillus cereus group]EEM56426.1 Glycoside hydrolase family 65, central catalytic [Bacillus thuringiensis serovar monterrey BGSC 4AJ1]KAB5639537.1 glycoside hydrolase family 65 protein [Bacillus thuringiensis]MEB9670109.1 glycosyl hydrolase family 65 protein [Bacillus anthracis]OTW55668.1 family 65 glycosyl hydrolase [Bacillus thuringiensis serovar mexicanensis]OTX05519.1 family 65 glycosyl hydrolase [Bacillus thuringiensis serovar monterr